MKTNKLFCLPFLMLVFGFIMSGSARGQNNLALTAKVTTSYVSGWENLDAVNDDYQPASSTDKGPGAYGNWKGTAFYDTWNWVEYTFDGKDQVDSVRVYWWTDGGGIQIPGEAFVEYLDCNTYVRAGDIGIIKDKYNSLVLDTVTYKVRISMKSTAATGILELQAWGSAGEPTGLVPFMQINGQPQQQVSRDTVNIGDTLVLSNGIIGLEGGTWSWTGPKGFVSSDSVVTIKGVELVQTGKYTASYITECGIAFEQDFVVLMHIADDQAYYWPKYTPTLDYNFKEEFPDLDMPTKDLDDCGALVAGTQSSGWWTFKWGKNKRSEITEAAITPMLKRMNEEFAYFRDSMGWPPDKRVKDGYRSTIYLYGSGLCTDDADSNATGGWQGSINGYPMVLVSYYPVYCFDPACPYTDIDFQTGAMVHEGIHSVLADLPGCKDACWFQEGGNTWLQQEANSRRSGDYSSMGYLNGGTFVAPFMPVECYSGWLQDNSFGGPCAQGVNMYSGSKQICTWRNYLGGTQYGNAFPTLLGKVLGKGSIPWIWRYCEGRVLEGMADTLGDLQIRRLITEYRAKQALIDMGEWTGAVRKLMDSYTNISIGAEWTPSWLTPSVWISSPYARTTIDSTGVLTPEYRTTPGWSGANQIPLQVKGDSVFIDFMPLGKNMKCLICYRDINGDVVYSEPVDSGACAMLLQRPPANDVVIAVIANTDYIYEGEATRKAHFDYRIRIDTTLTTPAHTHKRWFAWDDNPSEDIPPVLPGITRPDTFPPTDILLALNTLYESDLIGTEVGTLSTIDSNSVNVQTYTFVTGEGDTDNASFKISGTKLQIKTALDYETNPLCSVRVRTRDVQGNTFDKSFEIPVLDAEESSFAQNTVANSNILFYPNPFDHSATIKIMNDGLITKIEIINLTGSTVKVIPEVNSGQCIISRDNLPDGIYYIKVHATDTYYLKAILQ